MDEVRQLQAWIVAVLGAIVGVGFLYVRRVEVGGAARAWAWSWFCFFVSLVFAVWTAPASVLLAHATGTLFPALLLVGALAFADRSIPRWLLPGALLVGLARGQARILGAHGFADLGVWLVEAPLDLAAAWILYRAAAQRGRSPAVLGLALAHAIFGALEVANVYYLAPGVRTPFAYFALGVVATLALALLQMMVLMERRRNVHVSDLEMLRGIAQSALAARDIEGLAEGAMGEIRRRLGLDLGGVWVVDESNGHLRCIYSFGHDSPLPPRYQSVPPEMAMPFEALHRSRPTFVDDVHALHQTSERRWLGEEGAHCIGVIPLRKRGADLGVIGVSRGGGKSFDASERHVLDIASQELSLALDHVGAVAKLDAERRVLASVVETSPTGILISNRAGEVQITNATFAQHLGERGGESWVGKRVDALVSDLASRFVDPEEFARAFLDLGPERSVFTTPVTLARPHERELLIFSAPIAGAGETQIGRVWISRDVTEERRLQAELRQTHKMETLGTLAGGVAHDFNNQLAAILGNARLMLREEDRSDLSEQDIQEILLDIERAANHCASLTRSLLAFARRSPLSREALHPGWVVDQVGALLRSLLPSTIRFEVSAKPDLPPVLADSTQLQQILINLVVNARDAVGSDGRIRLEVGSRAIEEPTAERQRAGRFVEFSVSDDGSGIDADTRHRIFDPFFTTKDVSEGTGLGLAVVYGATRAHEGWVEVESEPGRGSTFRVLIPAAPAAARELGGGARDQDDRGPARAGSGTILLADDEEKLRRLVGRLLTQVGYRVIEAGDGLEAVETFERSPETFDMVVLDITMPGLDGLAALERIRATSPDMPALVMSGLTAIDEAILRGERTDFITKPFELEAVHRAVARLIR